MNLKVVFSLALLITTSSSIFMKNRYVANVENVEMCPNNDAIGRPIRNLAFRHFNRTHKSLTYEFSYVRPLDERVAGSIVVERWGNSGWIKMPFIGPQPNICEYVLQHFEPFWVDFHKNVGIETADRCPLPAGNYSVKDLLLDPSEIDMPFFSGDFRFTTSFVDMDTNEEFFCIVCSIKITEVF